MVGFGTVGAAWHKNSASKSRPALKGQDRPHIRLHKVAVRYLKEARAVGTRQFAVLQTMQ